MKTWFYKNLGDAIMAAQPSDKIREAFMPLFNAAGSPEAMAIFTRSDSVDRLHCEVSVYFSPAAADIAETFDAQPCEQPLKAGLELLLGNKGSWSVLFPES